MAIGRSLMAVFKLVPDVEFVDKYPTSAEVLTVKGDNSKTVPSSTASSWASRGRADNELIAHTERNRLTGTWVVWRSFIIISKNK